MLAVDLTNPDLLVNGHLHLPRATIHLLNNIMLGEDALFATVEMHNFGAFTAGFKIAFDLDADFADQIKGENGGAEFGLAIRGHEDFGIRHLAFVSAETLFDFGRADEFGRSLADAPVATMRVSAMTIAPSTAISNGYFARSTVVTAPVRNWVPKRAACLRKMSIISGP